MKGNQDVGRICDNNGQLLCDEKEVRARWKDYFDSLLESDQSSNTQVPGQRVEQRRDQDVNQLDVDCTEKISVEEVRKCIRRLKNRKDSYDISLYLRRPPTQKKLCMSD